MIVSVQRVSCGAERGDQESREPRDDEAKRTDRKGKEDNRRHDKERATPGVGLEMRAFLHDADDRYRGAEPQQENRKHARRRSRPERKSVHALQIAARPQRE